MADPTPEMIEAGAKAIGPLADENRDHSAALACLLEALAIAPKEWLLAQALTEEELDDLAMLCRDALRAEGPDEAIEKLEALSTAALALSTGQEE